MDSEAEPVTRTLRLIAPGKLNWSLEVLRFRPDGYHEIRSVLQTIDLCDVITLEEAADVSLDITGDAGMLGDDPIDTNLAYRAALAFQKLTRARRGVHIVLEKHVPVAAGLGGGSSDAAAVLRGLNVLWGIAQPEANLIEIAGELGSDPAFFVVGGTAAVSGRGEHVEPLPDAIAPSILLATPPQNARGEKTAGMFAALTPDDFAEGDVTIGVRDTVCARRSLVDGELNNVFEHVTRKMQPATELAMDALRAEGFSPHLAGAGPSFFLLYPEVGDLVGRLSNRLSDLGFEARLVHALPRIEALGIEER
jgi:4-diphosphocytidyl-2-C-methyl-D-erythritol kinase